MRLIRNKVTTYLVVTSLVSIGIVTFIYLYFGASCEKIKRNFAESQLVLLQNHIKVNSLPGSRALIKISEFASLRNSICEENKLPEGVGELLNVAGFEFVAGTDASLSHVMAYPPEAADFLKILPSDRKVFEKLLSDGKVTRYYAWQKDSLYEISIIKAAVCQDAEESSVQWLFGGKYVEKELVNSFILSYPGKLSIQRPPAPAGSSIRKNTQGYSTTLPLYGWDNYPVASVHLETQPGLVLLLSDLNRMLLWLLAASVVLFSLFTFLYLNRFYILPLKLISLAIRHKDPDYIKMMDDKDPDFNSLQNMLINVFNQEKLLSDIMNRRSTEMMNTFHAAILSKLSDSVYAYDHKGVITYWNKSAEELYGIPEEEAVGKIAYELVKSKWKKAEEERFQTESLKNTGIWKGRLVQELPDGSEINVEATVSALSDNDDKLIGYLCVVRKPVNQA